MQSTLLQFVLFVRKREKYRCTVQNIKVLQCLWKMSEIILIQTFPLLWAVHFSIFHGPHFANKVLKCNIMKYHTLREIWMLHFRMRNIRLLWMKSKDNGIHTCYTLSFILSDIIWERGKSVLKHKPGRGMKIYLSCQLFSWECQRGNSIFLGYCMPCFSNNMKAMEKCKQPYNESTAKALFLKLALLLCSFIATIFTFYCFIKGKTFCHIPY